jgi:hypothetical protein
MITTPSWTICEIGRRGEARWNRSRRDWYNPPPVPLMQSKGYGAIRACAACRLATTTMLDSKVRLHLA